MATTLERFLSDESCGKTIPCRIGVRRLYEMGQRATTGLSKPNDPQALQDLPADVRAAALCGLEYCAPNPFLSGMRYFADEFDQHFTRGTCPAGVCNPVRVASPAMTRRERMTDTLPQLREEAAPDLPVERLLETQAPQRPHVHAYLHGRG